MSKIGGDRVMQLCLIKNPDCSRKLAYDIARIVYAHTGATSLRVIEAMTSMISNASKKTGREISDIISDSEIFLHCILILNITPACLCRPIVVRFRHACERPGECCTTICQTCALVRPVFIMRTKCQRGPRPVVIFWTLMDCCFISGGD